MPGNICVYLYPNGYLDNQQCPKDEETGGLWHKKDHMWFGATLDVQDTDGPGSVTVKFIFDSINRIVIQCQLITSE